MNAEQELKDAQAKLKEAQDHFDESQKEKLKEARQALAAQESEEQKQIEEQRQLQALLEKKRIEKETQERAELAKQEAQRVVLDTRLSNAEAESIILLKRKRALEGVPEREHELRELKKKLLASDEKINEAKEELRLYTETQQRSLEEKIRKSKEQDEYWQKVRIEQQEALEAERRKRAQEMRDLEADIERKEQEKREQEKKQKSDKERAERAMFAAEQERVAILRRNFYRVDQGTSNPLQRFFQKQE